MTDDNTSPSLGVVDPSILDTTLDEQGGIPTFLQRQPDNTVMVGQDSQHEGEAVIAALPEQPLNAEEHGYVDEDPEADQPADEATSAPVFTTSEDAQGQTTLAVENELPPTNHNRPADPEEMRRDFFKDVNRFGKASGEGASALGRLGMRALRAAADGILSTAKPQGGGKDDATLVYEAYTAMDSKHAEHTAGGSKANASKLRQIIGMGCMTTITDPVAIGDKVVRIREEMEGAELKPKALFAALVDVAREQQASDTELTDNAIRDALTKTAADKTLEKEWGAIQKRVEKLITGEASHGLKDDSERALKISDMLIEHVKNFVADGTRKERIENMMELGYTSAQAEAIVDKKISV